MSKIEKMSKLVKKQIDAEIYALVQEGNMSKVAIAKMYDTSPRSVGRAVERHVASMQTIKKAVKTKKPVAAKKSSSKTKVGTVKVQPAKLNPIQQALNSGKAVEYIITGDSIIMTLGNDNEIIDSTHANFKGILKAIVDERYQEAFDLMNIKKSIERFSQGLIKIEGDSLFYGSVPIKSVLVDKILSLMSEGDATFGNLVNFFEKLMENPSKDSVEQLWGFISHNDVEIDSEGYIIGWKKVNRNAEGWLFDDRTGKVPNDLGNIVEMPRWMVDDNRNVTCSQGLHVGAWDYVSSFSGNTILKVRVHPRDVVAVPTDYSDMKMRSARYEVVATVDYKRQVKSMWDGKSGKHVVVGRAGELISIKDREL